MTHKISSYTFALLLLFLPTQLSKHYWPTLSHLGGFRIDYLSPTLYFTDLLIIILFYTWLLLYFPRLSPTFTGSRLLTIIFISTLLALSTIFFIPYIPQFYAILTFIKLVFLAYFTFTYHPPRSTKLPTIIAFILIYTSSLAIFQFLLQSTLNGPLYWIGERTFSISTPGIAKTSICEFLPHIGYYLDSSCQLFLRPYATFPHPNALAGFLLLMIIIIQSPLLSIPKSLRHVTIFTTISALFLTFSRTVISTWAIISCVNLFRSLLPFHRRFYLYLTYTSLIWSLFYPAFHLLSTHPSFTINSTSQSYTLRTQNYLQALQLISIHPLIGHGPGQTIPALTTLANFYPSPRTLQPIHNFFWQLTTQIGLLGLLCTLYLIHRLIQYLKYQPNSNSKLLIFSVLLLTSATDHYWFTLHQNQLLLALTIGLILRRSNPPQL